MKALAREIALTLRDWTTVAVVCVGLCAIAASALQPLRSIRVQAEAVDKAESDAGKQLKKTIAAVAKSEAGYHAPMGYEMPGVLETREQLYNFVVVLPPAPLAAASMHLSSDRPEMFSVYDHNDEHPSLLTGKGRLLSNVTAFASPSNPLSAFVGSFDLLFVVTVVLPLLVIGLASDLIASDAQSGTLRLLLAQGISVWRLLLLRVSARALVSLVPWLVVSVSMMALVEHRGGSEVPWMRIGWWTAIAALYLVLWFLLCLFANAWLRTHLKTALFTLGGWTTLILLTPMAVGIALRVACPAVPSLLLSDVEKTKREAANETMNAAYLATMEAFHKQSGIDPLKLTPEERPHYLSLLRTTPFPTPHGNAALDCYFHTYPLADDRAMHYQQYYAAQIGRDCLMTQLLHEEVRKVEADALAQEHAAAWFAWLSPMLTVRSTLAYVAGSDGTRYKEFLNQFDNDLRRREMFFGVHMRAYTPVFAAELVHVPQFQFSEPAFDTGVVLRVASLLLVFALAMLFASWRFAIHRRGVITE